MTSIHPSYRKLAALHMIGSSLILLSLLGIRHAYNEFTFCWRASCQAMVKIGNCELLLPQRYASEAEVKFYDRHPHLKCPAPLLWSLGAKAPLRCATLDELRLVKGIGTARGRRLFENRDATTWTTLRQRAKLSEKQLRAVKARFVLSQELNACPS